MTSRQQTVVRRLKGVTRGDRERKREDEKKTPEKREERREGEPKAKTGQGATRSACKRQESATSRSSRLASLGLECSSSGCIKHRNALPSHVGQSPHLPGTPSPRSATTHTVPERAFPGFTRQISLLASSAFLGWLCHVLHKEALWGLCTESVDFRSQISRPALL